MTRFDNTTKERLEQPPPAEHLSTRKGSERRELTYIEGWYAIQVANQVFGADGWSRGFAGDGLQTVHKETLEIPQKNGGSRQRHDVAMTCQYRITVGEQTVEDVGYGVGQSYIGYGDAYESAAKEAVTDAMKRCLRSFGNAFGNCLYDKAWLRNRRYPQNRPADAPAQQPINQPLPEPPIDPMAQPATPQDKNALIDVLTQQRTQAALAMPDATQERTMSIAVVNNIRKHVLGGRPVQTKADCTAVMMAIQGGQYTLSTGEPVNG